MTEGTSSYQVGNVGDHAVVMQGEHLSLYQVINNLPLAPRAFSYRGIAGVPPATEQSTIQPRTHLVEAIYTQLRQPGINALALTGLGGMGKSTLAALLYQYVQAQSSAGNGFFQEPPLWLSIDQAATFADVIGTLFQRLDKPLSVLDTLSPAGQVEALFTLLDRLELPRLIVLDQFDNLLDWATGRALPTQPGVGEWLDALNSRHWKSNGRLLLTSRSFPQGTRVATPLCFQEYPVSGLTLQEGLALLRSRGIAAETDLQKAVTFCDGHPLSLVLVMALIQLYGIPLTDLLAEPTLWVGDIATNLLDTVFQHLTEEQRTALRALSVYRTAVPVAALAPFLTGSSPQQVLLSLRPLLVQHVIQLAGQGRYQVHVVVGRYAQTHFVEGDEPANQYALRAAHSIAAHYYLQLALVSTVPREQRRRINDIQEIIEAVWQYTQAAQWQEAYILVEQEHLLSDLFVWGGNSLLLGLCQWFLPQIEWQPEPKQAVNIYVYLGRAYGVLGKYQQALEYYQQALSISREAGDRKGEGLVLGSIGSVYLVLGDQQQAFEYSQQALKICREAGDRENEGAALVNIGLVYYQMDNQQQALEYYQQALSISREASDRRSESVILTNIGNAYHALGDQQQALEYYQQALSISREAGDRGIEGGALANIGLVYFQMGNQQQALEYYQQALGLCREVGNRGSEGLILDHIGDAYYRMDNQRQSLEYYQQALQIYRELGTLWNECAALSGIGSVYHALGDRQQALEYYQQALGLCREVGNRVIEDVTLRNIGLVYFQMGNQQQALEYYQQALGLCREVGNRGSESVILTNIGSVYHALGDQQQALEYYQQALQLYREVGDRENEGLILRYIGLVYYRMDNQQQELEYYQQALQLYREIGDRENEVLTLRGIGSVYYQGGDQQQALEYYQQALQLYREVGDRENEGVILTIIGSVHLLMDDQRQALEYYQQALQLYREVGDRENEGVILTNIGDAYHALGDQQQALEYYQQALSISREIGDRENEGNTLNNIGALALGQHHYDLALAASLLARQCFEEVSNPQQQEVEAWIDAFRRKIGKKRFATLQARVEPQTRQFFEQALHDWQAQHEKEA